ncbi:MAG: hypothetical protein WA192_12965 [Candidatus Acidiferrales bacterium]
MASSLVVVCFACACAVSHKTVVQPSQAPGPLQSATREELLNRYNQQVHAIRSLNAGVTMKLTAGSAYSGVIEQYHEVNGFIMAARPASIYVIGQAPVVAKDIFTMVSDGSTFSIYIPSKNKFIVGPADLQRRAEKPIENLRPQHLVDALFWPPITDREPVLFEEASEGPARFYILTVARPDAVAPSGGIADLQIAEKIWFNRTDLRVSRIEDFASGGTVASDVSYANWQPTGTATYPWQINVIRPGDDYELQITIKKITVNEPIAADRFALPQPPGTDLVRLGADTGDAAAHKDSGQKPKEPQP